MALQSSGQISFQDIQDEFGGSHPIQANEYYRNGGLVTSHNSGVPTSGQIGINSFYGTQSLLLDTTMNVGYASDKTGTFIGYEDNYQNSNDFGSMANRQVGSGSLYIQLCKWVNPSNFAARIELAFATTTNYTDVGQLSVFTGWSSIQIHNTTYNRTSFSVVNANEFRLNNTISPFATSTAGTTRTVKIFP